MAKLTKSEFKEVIIPCANLDCINGCGGLRAQKPNDRTLLGLGLHSTDGEVSSMCCTEVVANPHLEKAFDMKDGLHCSAV